MAKQYKPKAKYAKSYDDHDEVIAMLKSAQAADHDLREIAREMHLFVSKRDGQWESRWWNNCAGKPRYTFDMVSPVLDQVSGEIEQASFDIRITPGGGDATKDIALTYEGMVRNIENMSGAKNIYEQSTRLMLEAGLDGWRVCQKYVDADSFDQDLIIEKINNYLDRVWHDPAAERQDKQDARYCFVLHPVAKDEYEHRWPNGSEMSVSDDREAEAYYDKRECIVVGELLYAKLKRKELVLMSNSRVYEDNEDFAAVRDELAALGITEKRRRTVDSYVWCSRFFDADDWLEDSKETVFTRCPVIPIYGNFKILENKTVFYGIVEKIVDPQRVMNYSMSREIEEGALAPRAKYWMTQAQAAGHENELATLNTNSDPVQFYNHDPENPGPPQQNGGAQINAGLRTISEAMRQVIGQTAGMFAANMGDNPGLQSGVAIERLQDRGNNGTIKYFRALEVAIEATGRVLVDAIPRVYDTERTIRVLYEDETYDMVPLNQQVIDGQTGRVITLNDLNQGKYDVVCTAGPAFQSRQQETLAMLVDVAKIDPTIIQMGGDLLLTNINSPAAKQLSERRRAQMVAQGLIPESQLTDEEKQQVAAKAQQQQQPDPAMVLAQAEMVKAQAEMQNAQNKQMELQIRMFESQARAQNDQQNTAIKGFDAQTKRFSAEVDAASAGRDADFQSLEVAGKQLDNLQKVRELSIPAGSSNG